MFLENNAISPTTVKAILMCKSEVYSQSSQERAVGWMIDWLSVS